MADYDLAVVGAGPGGYVAAIRGAQLGAKTVVVERSELGGVCLNWGCIPAKTFIHTAELLEKARSGARFGVVADSVELDMKALQKHKKKVIKTNKAGIAALFKAHGIEVVNGEAVVSKPGVLRVGDDELSARSIILAPGGAPAQIPGLEFNGTTVIGSTEALEMTEVPSTVAVIGAGALGAEFACIYNAFGAEVTLIEMMPDILPKEDKELTRNLAGLFKKRGVDVRTGTKVAQLDVGKNGARLKLTGPEEDSIDVHVVLVGIGLKCNSELVTKTPDLGIETGKRGGIVVDERMETGVPGIYAIGDVIDKTWLAHGASAEALVAAANATGGNETMDYRVVPACNFTMPELAGVGMTESEAREAGIDTRVGRFSYRANGRAHAIGEAEGMVKIIGDAETDEVIGVHILGAQAGELIAVASVAMTMEATVEELAETIQTHPTLSETIKEAAEDYFGMGIHVPPR